MKYLYFIIIITSGCLRNNMCEDGGIANGIMRRYYDNGILKSEAMIKNCLSNGAKMEYYKDGKLKELSYSVSGVVSSDMINFDTAGNVCAIQTWKNIKLLNVKIIDGVTMYLLDVEKKSLLNTNTHLSVQLPDYEVIGNQYCYYCFVNKKYIVIETDMNCFIYNKDLKLLFDFRREMTINDKLEYNLIEEVDYANDSITVLYSHLENSKLTKKFKISDN